MQLKKHLKKSKLISNIELSNVKITSHAIIQYSLRIKPLNTNYEEIINEIKNRLIESKLLSINSKDLSKQYINGENIFVIKDNILITVYKKDKINQFLMSLLKKW